MRKCWRLGASSIWPAILQLCEGPDHMVSSLRPLCDRAKASTAAAAVIYVTLKSAHILFNTHDFKSCELWKGFYVNFSTVLFVYQ